MATTSANKSKPKPTGTGTAISAWDSSSRLWDMIGKYVLDKNPGVASVTTPSVGSVDVPWLGDLFLPEMGAAPEVPETGEILDLEYGSADAKTDAAMLAAHGRAIEGMESSYDRMSAQNESMLKGELPADLAAAVRRAASETSVASGTFGGAARALSARDLGRTSYDVMQQGMQNEANIAAGRKGLAEVAQAMRSFNMDYGLRVSDARQKQSQLMLNRAAQGIERAQTISDIQATRQDLAIRGAEAQTGRYAQQVAAAQLRNTIAVNRAEINLKAQELQTGRLELENRIRATNLDAMNAERERAQFNAAANLQIAELLTTAVYNQQSVNATLAQNGIDTAGSNAQFDSLIKSLKSLFST